MKLIWHIFKKDARRLAWPLVGLSVVTVMPMLLAITAPAKGEANSYFTTIANTLTFLIPRVVTYLLVMSLLADDIVAGGNVFWTTRPISGARLLLAKFLGIVLLLWVLPVLIALPWWLFHGYGLSELSTAAKSTFQIQATITLLALPIAALSEKSGRFLTISFGALVLVPIVTRHLTLNPNEGGISLAKLSPELIQSRAWVVFALLLVGGAAVTVNQFLTRRNWLSWTFVAIAALSLLGVLRFWSWDFCSGLASKMESALAAPLTVQVTKGRQLASRQEAKFGYLKVQYELRGLLPPLVISRWTAKHSLVWPNQTVSSHEKPSYAQDTADDAGLALLKPQDSSAVIPRWAMFELPDATTVERLAREAPAYRGEIHGRLLRPEIVAELPLREGAAVQGQGFGVRIESLRPWDGTDLRVQLSEHSPEFVTNDSTYFVSANNNPLADAYFIINRKAGGVLCTTTSQRQHVFSVATVQRFRQEKVFFPRTASEQPVGDLAAWLADAVLVKIVFRDQGAFHRTVETPRLEIAPAPPPVRK